MNDSMESYFAKADEVLKEYGAQSAVFVRDGSFYEMYGLVRLQDIQIQAIAKLCQLTIHNRKKNKVSVKVIGFRDYKLNTYIGTLQKNNYTVAVVSDESDEMILHSPGTSLLEDDNGKSNSSVCVWLQKIRCDRLVVGMSSVDIISGVSSIYEYDEENTLSPTTYDQLEQFISINNPAEIIFIHNLEENIMDRAVKCLNLTYQHLHIMSRDGSVGEKNRERIINCEKQTYQKEILERFFSKDAYVKHRDHISSYPVAMQAYCFLLDFLYKHNPNLVLGIKEPSFQNTSNYMVMSNHTLKQLNILGDKNENTLSSILNQCVTAVGMRKMHLQISHPITNKQALELEYDTTEHLIKECDISMMRKGLTGLKDTEKLNRKAVMQKAKPSDLLSLANDLQKISGLLNTVEKNKIMKEYIKNVGVKDNIIETTDLVIKKIRNTVQEGENYIVAGSNRQHDRQTQEWENTLNVWDAIKSELNSKIGDFEGVNEDYVKVDKAGYSFVTTKRRGAYLEKCYAKVRNEEITLTFRKNRRNSQFKLDVSAFTYTQMGAGHICISSQQIREVSERVCQAKTSVMRSCDGLFEEFLRLFVVECGSLVEDIVFAVGQIDCIYTKAYVAKKMNYCKPTISEAADNNMISARGVRHPLVEALLEDEIYVPNDILFDDKHLGYLIYGTNATGKSCYIKSIGIAVIMVQSGFFAPCVSMVYSPFDKLYTRITGGDDMHKGLSTFALEMMEFRTILCQSDVNSLILGDELCSGTEVDSAIGIFVAGLKALDNRNCCYMFATHYHEIARYEEITSTKRLHIKHMSVRYDRESDILVYDRRLKNGPGESMYGLEVCKSLHMPPCFMDYAHEIRTKYKSNTLCLLDGKTSTYNSKKVKGMCEMCNCGVGEEVHHLQFQREANGNDYIQNSFHKNHIANLMTVCGKCHQKLHQGEKRGMKRVKTTKGVILVNVD